MPIYVVAKQWMWHAEHPAGEREINELHVPIGRPVELVMTSQDVIHSLSLPGFRIKQDVLPGRYTTLWFTANRPGEYHLFCTQYCGASHSHMVGRVVVMEPAAFEGWLSEHASVPTMAARGAQRYLKLGCNGCHGAQAAVGAPRLEGLFGSRVRLTDGRSVLADERFVRDAVMLPSLDVPAGYESNMPSYRGQISEEDLLEIVEYVKSLGNATHQETP
jgi:cytochrome c oxidase subunit 2